MITHTCDLCGLVTVVTGTVVESTALCGECLGLRQSYTVALDTFTETCIKNWLTKKRPPLPPPPPPYPVRTPPE